MRPGVAPLRDAAAVALGPRALLLFVKIAFKLPRGRVAHQPNY